MFARPVLLLLAILIIALSGCGRLAQPNGAAVDGGAATAGPAPAIDSPPRWAPTQELVTGGAADTAPGPAQPVFDVSDPATLRAQVKDRCSAPEADQTGMLTDVADALLGDGVEPGRAADALIRAECGGVAAIVRALVATGGAPVVASVVDRALFLAGPAAEPIIAAAVSDGLRQDLPPARRSVAGGDVRGEAGLRYAIAYFPVAGGRVEIDEGDSMARLFGAARPGYGLYTFILSGSGDDERARQTYRELLRVIETYVLVADGAPALPADATHAFLVPVRPERSGAALLDQTDPALSTPMRDAFAAWLGEDEQPELSQALIAGSGPFLVTTLEPSLVPTSTSPRGPGATRLLTDLSNVGPAYAYAIIDAFDRPIPVEQAGTVGSLGPIRTRLLALRPGGDDGLAGSDWVHTLGEPLPSAQEELP